MWNQAESQEKREEGDTGRLHVNSPTQGPAAQGTVKDDLSSNWMLLGSKRAASQEQFRRKIRLRPPQGHRDTRKVMKKGVEALWEELASADLR